MARLLMGHLNGMDQKMHLHHLDVIDNFRDRRHLQDAVHLVALQNLVAQNQDVVLTFRDVHLAHQLDVVVDEELHHLLRMDCFQGVVDVELLVMFHLQLKMDCCRDVERLVYFQLLVLHHPDLKQKTVLVLEQIAQRFRRAMPLALLNRRQVRRRVQRQVQG